MMVLRRWFPLITIVTLLALVGLDRFDWRFALFGFLAPLALFAAAVALHVLRRRSDGEGRGVF